MKQSYLRLNKKSMCYSVVLLVVFLIVPRSFSSYLNKPAIFNRINGTWIRNNELTYRLGGQFKIAQVTFNVNNTFKKKISERILRKLKEKNCKIILGGDFTAWDVHRKEIMGKAIFFVVYFKTNPVILLQFKERGRTGIFLAHFSIALAKNRKNDILFLGAPGPEQAFSALIRTKSIK